jgi:L-serine dehydratase
MDYNFSNSVELVEQGTAHQMPIWQVMLNREVDWTKKTEEEIRERMAESLLVMKQAIEAGLKPGVKSVSGLIGGEAYKLKAYGETEEPLSGRPIFKAITNAMSVIEVNASMGKIVASPTAGSCGILPGALVTTGIERGKTDEELVNALLTGAAVGFLVSRNATVAGAEGGCQAETGTASAMAAAGIVEMMGGSPEQALSAAAFTIKNILGLVCDPIAGLVECPCAKRNALGSANAIISADMALAGILTIIPLDEVIETMYKVGKILSPTLKETAMGGLAVTPTGIQITKKIFG